MPAPERAWPWIGGYAATLVLALLGATTSVGPGGGTSAQGLLLVLVIAAAVSAGTLLLWPSAQDSGDWSPAARLGLVAFLVSLAAYPLCSLFVPGRPIAALAALFLVGAAVGMRHLVAVEPTPVDAGRTIGGLSVVYAVACSRWCWSGQRSS